MSFWITCITGIFVLMEVMLCKRICLAGVHVFRIAYLIMCFTGMNVTGGQVLLEGT